MIRALGIINSERFLERPLRRFMDEQALASGVALDWRVVAASNRGDYKPWFRECPNVISWGYKMPQRWMTASGQNVLFIENSLVRQDMGIFVDHAGWFSDSNLAKRQNPDQAAHVDLSHLAKEWFGWTLGAGGNASGPVLVCLQTPRDASIRYHFPAGSAVPPDGKTDHFLRLLHEHLPPGQYLIRPHPKNREGFTPGVWRSDWTLDDPGSLRDRLPQCSALVAVNSTCVSEAMLLGIPVATLGVGAFTGHGATLECHEDFSRLALLSTWRPRWSNCVSYLRALMGRHFMSYEMPDAWPCQEWNSWLAAANQSEQTEAAKYAALYQSGLLPRYGHSNHGKSILDAVVAGEPESLLDVGCGYNEFVTALRRKMPNVRAVGVDFACPGADIQAAATSLPFTDAEFDMLTAFDVLEHVLPGDVDNTLREMSRVSRRFVFAICYGPGKATWEGKSLHPTIRAEAWWLGKIAAAGAVDVQVEGRFISGRWQA